MNLSPTAWCSNHTEWVRQSREKRSPIHTTSEYFQYFITLYILVTF